ncbi:MAG: transposase [Armatimonadota bacterium]|jgi:REP element-mobilizing transposase RayT
MSGDQPERKTVSADLTISQRDLPHWQVGGATYFITFRLKGHPGSEASGTGLPASEGVSPVEPAEATPHPLTPAERTIVMKAILFWHARKWSVDALTVMPDHVHVLATPLERSPGDWFSLTELMHSVKSFTAHRIQRHRRASGALWQSERYDRVNRDEHEFYQKATYILENAQRKGLVEYGWEYEWFWCPGKEQLGNRVRRG